MKLQNFLIAVDLDGTLITGFDNYDKKSFRYLKKLAKHNYVVIATGRPLRSSKYYYDLLKLTTPIVNYNGALLHNPSDPNFLKQTIVIDRNDLFTLMKDNEDIIETVFCEIEDDIYLYKETDYIHPYLHHEGGKMHIGDLKTILPNNPNGAIIFSKLGSEARLVEYVEKKFEGKVRIRIWYANTVVVSEFYSPKTSKANALQKICEYYQIPREKIIAIGDGHNDIDMINLATYGVAMANAHPELKANAKYHTLSVTDHGVYYYLKSLKKQ